VKLIIFTVIIFVKVKVAWFEKYAKLYSSYFMGYLLMMYELAGILQLIPQILIFMLRIYLLSWLA